MSFFFLLFRLCFLFSSQVVYLLELEIFKSFRLRKGSSEKNLGMAWPKPGRASLLGEAFGRRCRCLCHRWCSLNRWKDAEDFGLAISSSTYLLISIHRSPCRNWNISKSNHLLPKHIKAVEEVHRCLIQKGRLVISTAPAKQGRTFQDWIP